MLSLRAVQFLPEGRAVSQCRTSLCRRAAASAVSPLPGTRAPFTQWDENGQLGYLGPTIKNVRFILGFFYSHSRLCQQIHAASLTKRTMSAFDTTSSLPTVRASFMNGPSGLSERIGTPVIEYFCDIGTPNFVNFQIYRQWLLALFHSAPSSPRSSSFPCRRRTPPGPGCGSSRGCRPRSGGARCRRTRRNAQWSPPRNL